MQLNSTEAYYTKIFKMILKKNKRIKKKNLFTLYITQFTKKHVGLKHLKHPSMHTIIMAKIASLTAEIWRSSTEFAIYISSTKITAAPTTSHSLLTSSAVFP